MLPDVARPRCVGGVLHLGDEPLVVGRLVDVTVPRAAARRRSRAPIDVAALVGRGDGLTPYGDDVLCGWLAVHRGGRRARRPRWTRRSGRWRRTTTLLSATLLDCAMHGEVIPEFAAWLAALGHR